MNNLSVSVYEIDEFRKHAKIMFYLTSRNAKTTTTSGSKVMAQTVFLMFLMTLTLTFDLCSIDCHTK